MNRFYLLGAAAAAFAVGVTAAQATPRMMELHGAKNLASGGHAGGVSSARKQGHKARGGVRGGRDAKGTGGGRGGESGSR